MLDVIGQPLLEEAIEHRDVLVRYSIEEYHQLIDSGVLPETVRTELIDGLLVKKDRAKAGEDTSTVGNRHRFVVTKLASLASEFEVHGSFLQTQQPVVLPPNNEPEPDLSVIRGTIEDFRDHPPAAGDTIFVLEVSDSSLRRDLTVKLPIYARAVIAEYIVINLQQNVVLVHRKPVDDRYQEITQLSVSDILDLSMATPARIHLPISTLLA